MKIIGFFLFITVFIISCDSSFQGENSEKFAIFILQDEDITTHEALKRNLEDLELSSIPLIRYDDIKIYNQKEHKVFLRKQFSEYFQGDIEFLFSKLPGKPFVVTAFGKRIYLGSFVPGISSFAPNTPCIYDYTFNNAEKSFTISDPPIWDSSAYIDYRNDRRILEALKDKIIYDSNNQ